MNIAVAFVIINSVVCRCYHLCNVLWKHYQYFITFLHKLSCHSISREVKI